MRLARILLLALIVFPGLTNESATLSAAEAEPRVSVNYNKTPFKDALLDFQQKSGFRLAFSEKLISHAAPVTLQKENAPAEKVLLEILRPEGLEAVQTDQKLAAVVPGYSDLGMAKAFGRSLLTGIRLGNKLDGAVTDGDEVRVPGWTDEDDADLAMGITDVIISIVYFEKTRRLEYTDAEQRLEMLVKSADPAVRAGAIIPIIAGRVSARAKWVGAEIEKGLIDPHPAVRTAWSILFAVSLELDPKSFPLDENDARVRRMAADPEAAVRMAATFALMIGDLAGRNVDPDGSMLKAFLADRSAFVRQTPRLSILTNRRVLENRAKSVAHEKWHSLCNDGFQPILHDPNPIARVLGLGVSLLASTRDEHDRISKLTKTDTDPWMRKIAGILSPLLAGESKAPQPDLLAAIVSNKQSHQVSALVIGSLGYLSFSRVAKPKTPGTVVPPAENLIDLSPLTQLSRSKWLWSRLAGTFLDGAIPVLSSLSKPLSAEQLKDAELNFQQALRSPSEPVRLVALLGLAFRTELKPANVPPSTETLVAALHSRNTAEMMLGALQMSQHLSADALFHQIETLLADESRRNAAICLLSNLYSDSRELKKLSREEQQAWWTGLAEMVVHRQDPAFEAALTCRLSWMPAEPRKSVIKVLFAKGRIETVHRIVNANSGSPLRDAEEIRALLDRLSVMADNPEHRIHVLDTWAQFVASSKHTLHEHVQSMVQVLDKALSDENSTGAVEIKTRIRALVSFFEMMEYGPQSKRNAVLENLPLNISKVLEVAFSLAADSRFTPDAAILLGRAIEVFRQPQLAGKWAANHSLQKALDAAIQAVLAGSRDEDKAEVWAALAKNGDKPSIDALTQLVIKGKTTPIHLNKIINALSTKPQLVPPEFGTALLRIVREPGEDRNMRTYALSGLYIFRKPLADEIEALVLDDKLDVYLRAQAVHLSVRGGEKILIFQKALKSYDTLPAEVACALAASACNSLQADGAEALLMRVIEDKRLRSGPHAWSNFHSLFFHLSNSKALNALTAPEKLREALSKLETGWPAEERPQFLAHVLPQIKTVLKKLDESAAKSKPAVKPSVTDEF